MKVNLHIDRLVIEGSPRDMHDGPHLHAAVEAELARLLAAGGDAESFGKSRAVPLVRAEPIAGPPNQLGARIGQAIFGSIGR